MTTGVFNAFVSAHYFAIVVSLFVLFAAIELVAPLRASRERPTRRWLANFGLVLAVVLVLKLLAPALGLVSAMLAQYLGLGLFNRVDIAPAAALLAGVVALDFKQYWFHRLMHCAGAWRIHRVHHSDVEVDLTTGFRFHPFEAILNALVDVIVILLLGLAAEVVLLRQVLVYLSNYVGHANIALPARLDRRLQWLFVTPSMHRLHHALDSRAANCNFGVTLSVWDRLFGTYLARHPNRVLDELGVDYHLGLRDHRDGGALNLWRLLRMPFDARRPPRELERAEL